MRVFVQGLALLGVASCAAKQPPVQPPAQVAFDASNGRRSSSGSSVGRSDSLSTYLSGKGVSIPTRPDPTDPMRLSVRPDIMRIRFAVRAVRASAAESLKAAQATSLSIGQTFQQRVNAVTKPRGLTVTEVVDQGEPLGVAVTADGMIDVKVDDSLDFWKRNELHVRLVELTKHVAGTTNSPDETLSVRFNAPQPTVSNPEAHRAGLIQGWVARARAFAEAAQSEHAPLSIVDCEVPEAVQQSPVSVEEVELTLFIRCRIDTREGFRIPEPRAEY